MDPVTLITGQPGNGKTLYAITWVRREAEKEEKRDAQGNVITPAAPVFYARIKGVMIPGWTPINAFEWMTCPPGSIVLIDEAQQSDDPLDPSKPAFFGVRQRGAKVPPWAMAVETVRHGGIRLVIITQDPSLIDVHERRLVNRHFHVVRKFGTQRATVYEYQAAQDNPRKVRAGAIRHEWKYPREAYAWYKSAEVHTVKARIPMRVWVLLSIPFLVIGLVWYTWVYHLDPKRKMTPEQIAKADPQSGTIAPAGGAAPTGGGKLTPREYAQQFNPRVDGLAYTAPAYDEVTKVVAAPYPAACVRSSSRCQCYTQQATRLETTKELCESIAAGGFFVAWQQPVQQAVPLRPQEAPPPAGGQQVVASGFKTAPTMVAPSTVAQDETSPGRGRALPPPAPIVKPTAARS